MEILFIITSTLFLSSTILFLVLFKKMKNKWLKTSQELTESSQYCENLKNQVEKIKDELSTKRIGFYKDVTNLLSKKDKEEGKTGEPYNFIIYVKEIDRYTNGLSKIELTNIEIISGFDMHQYDWVKNCAKDRFSSIRKTSEIEWLESEEDIKEQRKLKLEKILNGI